MEQEISLVIVAGGKGSRMGSDIPKQYLPLGNKPIVLHSIGTFLQAFPQGQVIIVVPDSHEAMMQELLNDYGFSEQVEIVVGGAERYHSVANGLKAVTGKIVMIHDAVRPFITKELLNNLYQDTLKYGNAIPYIDMVESVRLADEDYYKHYDRDKIRIIQTPQSFDIAALKTAFSTGYQTIFTDDASVFESYYGSVIHLTKGIRENIKITTPLDMKVASVLIQDFVT